MSRRLFAPWLLLALAAALPAAGEEPPSRPGDAADARGRWADPFSADRSIRVVTAEEIWRSNARSLPELLREELGVWMTFDTYSGGGPILAGVGGNDILVLLDGIEVNNTAYRFGALEYLATIDLHMLERIEVTRGAAGRWAGDTAGPVIRLFSKRDAAPLAPGREVPAEATARATYRYSTVDKASIAHLEAHQREERYDLLFGLTTRDVGDLKGGGEVGFQRVTSYEEVSGHARVLYFLSPTSTFEVDAQILEQQNAPRYERTEGGSHLDFELDPRKRALFKLAYLETTDRRWSDRLEVGLYLHQQRQRAFEQRTATPEVSTRTSDNNDVLGLFARSEVELGAHRLSWGLDATEEEIGAVRRTVDVTSGEELERGRDPRRAGQSRDQLTLWIDDRLRLSDQLTLGFGGRWSSFTVSGSQSTLAGEFELDADDADVAAYVGLVWAPSETVRLFANYDRGFRLPGIDEVTSFVDAAGLAGLPASDLVAQTGRGIEIGARFANDRLSVSASLFSNEIDDAPRLESATSGGLPFADLDGDGRLDPGEPAWVATRSSGRYEIDGLDLELELALPWDLTLFAGFIATEGDDLEAAAPLAGVPPDHGGLGLRWRPSSRWAPWAEALIRWADDKQRLAPVELLDPTLDDAALAGHEVLTLRAGVTLPPRLRLVVTLENPNDEDYRPYGSFLVAPGRNLALTAEYTF